jgi:1-deoxy-D-xylulose-5-phosphate synthase
MHSNKKVKLTYSHIFGQWICDMANQDKRLVAITPAMREGSDLIRFEKEYPKRYFDVAIAEQHSVTLAAGMASEGLKPVVAIYSTFLQRAYDQLINDVVNQNLPVLFAIDRAGLVGSDGPTHNGSYDFTFLRCLPNMVVMAPSDENECRQMLYTGYMLNQPAAVRYPRGAGPGVAIKKHMQSLPIGKAEVKRTGKRIAILAFGSVVAPSIEVAEIIDATVVNMRFVKPLDEDIIFELASNYKYLVTIEENVVQGGAGSAVNEYLVLNKIETKVLNCGLPDKLISHGSQDDMLKEAGLTKEGILGFIEANIEMQYIAKTARSA